MDRLSELLGSHVQFTYTAWDRIVLNGYIERLQRPANLAYFFHEVAGIPCITPDERMSRTRAYRAWVCTTYLNTTSHCCLRPKASARRRLSNPTTVDCAVPRAWHAC